MRKREKQMLEFGGVALEQQCPNCRGKGGEVVEDTIPPRVEGCYRCRETGVVPSNAGLWLIRFLQRYT